MIRRRICLFASSRSGFLYGPLSAVDDDEDFLFSDCGTLANFNGYWCLQYIRLSCCFRALTNGLDVVVVRGSRCCYSRLESIEDV